MSTTAACASSGETARWSHRLAGVVIAGGGNGETVDGSEKGMAPPPAMAPPVVMAFKRRIVDAL